MKKQLAVLGAGSVLAIAASVANAGGWTFLPVVNDPTYKPEATIAVTVGAMSPDSNLGGTALAYGAEVSANCILIQPPTNRVRTTISYAHYDDGGLTLNDIELNPHYVVELTPDFWLGGGPGLGVLLANADTGSDATMLAGQLGASAHYRMGALFLGAEARYQWTQGKDVGTSDSGENNWRALAKVGFNF